MTFPKTHQLHCQEPWFSLLRSGKKKVEGRKNSAKYHTIAVQDTIEFYCDDERFTCTVTALKMFQSIEDYLHTVTFQAALPGIQSFEEAVRIYQQWNTPEEIEQHGFLAIFIQI